MIKALFNLVFAFALAAGIVLWVTQGNLERPPEAAAQALALAQGMKTERINAREAGEALRQAAQEALESGAPPAAPQPMPVQTRLSRAQDMTSQMRLTGRTEALRRVEARAQTSGVVIESPYEAGARVRRGDLLCRLDMGDRAARRAEAEARMRSAQASADAQNRLSERGFAARNTQVSAQSSAESIRAQIQQIDVEIARTEIYAPFDGVLEESPARSGALLQPGSVCAKIMDPDPMLAVGFAPERDIAKLSEGQAASLRLADGRALTGRVRLIGASADSATRTLRVEVEFQNSDYAIREGLTAEIRIDLAPQRGHLLPQSALTLNDDGVMGVRIAQEGAARFVPAAILRDGAEGVWVSGLPETARVIVVGQEYVIDGAPVRAVDMEAGALTQ